jgi:DNA polymerase III subunit gamma/tau
MANYMSSTYEYRPRNLKDIVGCDVNKKLLLSVAKNSGPSVYIFNGDYGCGKTTMARCFVRMCLCENLTDDICGKCEACTMDLDNSQFYSEFDSSLVNRVENIRDLYEDLTWVPRGKKRVITFDEFHLTSRAAQSALLKLFEDAPPNIYYVLCTTDKSAILPTIISRSLTLEFHTKSKEEVISNLNKIANERNINLPEAVANLIALRSKGHMRDAHKLFEKYLLIGEKDFLNLEESGYVYLAKYFAQVLWLIKNIRASSEDIKKHKEVMMELVDRIMRIPIALLKDDYQNLFLDLAKKCFNSEYKVEPIIEAIVKQFDVRSIMNLYKVALDDFSMSSFDSDIRFQTALFSIYQRLLMGI